MARKPAIGELPNWPRLMAQATAAAYCGISLSHFLGACPVAPVKIGEKPLWDRQDLDRWIDALHDGGASRYDPWDNAIDRLGA